MKTTFELASGTYHALELGDAGARPLVFLHGFPDHPPTAIPFLEEVAAAGFHVLAPYLPGYAPSPTRGPMTRERNSRDLLALINDWSPHAPVDLVGHDWGAVMTYVLCAMEPTRIRRAVTMAVPHPKTFMRQLRTAAQLRASWYMMLFQLPGAGHLVAARDFALVDKLWRDWSPSFELTDEERRELHACLAASMPAPINWYRATARDTKGLRLFAKPLATPLLYLHGIDDGCILPPAVDDSHRFSSHYRRDLIAGRGHFLHLEDPVGIAARVTTWLS